VLGGVLLACIAAGPEPSTLRWSPGQTSGETVRLEIRVFAGTEDVSTRSRVQIHPSGTRTTPVAAVSRGERHVVEVATGLYDVQAIVEHEGRVVGIRWAERLAVMAYPDEAGDHLEVINVRNGFGALQVRAKDGGPVQGEAMLYPSGSRDAASRVTPAARTAAWMLFVVPAGRYDLVAGEDLRHEVADIEITADRTRLKIQP
jgi:hypothetical protein